MGNETREVRQKYLARRQGLRMAIAAYFAGMAMGIVPLQTGQEILSVVLPDEMQSSLFSILVFAAAYFIMIGKHLRIASGFLLALVLITRLNAPAAGIDFYLIRDAVLVTALLLTGGWFMPKHSLKDAPGRIRLTRIIAPKRPLTAPRIPANGHAFAQSPDDMARLFDQIGEAH